MSQMCQPCQGSGRGPNAIRCPNCEGTGKRDAQTPAAAIPPGNEPLVLTHNEARFVRTLRHHLGTKADGEIGAMLAMVDQYTALTAQPFVPAILPAETFLSDPAIVPAAPETPAAANS